MFHCQVREAENETGSNLCGGAEDMLVSGCEQEASRRSREGRFHEWSEGGREIGCMREDDAEDRMRQRQMIGSGCPTAGSSAKEKEMRCTAGTPLRWCQQFSGEVEKSEPTGPIMSPKPQTAPTTKCQNQNLCDLTTKM